MPEKPPSHLSARSKRLWRYIHETYMLAPPDQALLQLALEALDRSQGARRAIARDGAYIHNRYGNITAHPALKIESAARMDFSRLMRQLQLPEPEEDAIIPFPLEVASAEVSSSYSR